MFLTGEDVNLNVPTIAAINEIAAQALTTKTLAGNTLYRRAELSKPSRGKIVPAMTPMIYFRIVDETPQKIGITSSSFTRICDRVEVVLSIIFSTPPKWDGQESNIQALGSALRDITMRSIETKNVANPTGFDRQPPFWWSFVNDQSFKAKLSRGVTRFDVTETMADPIFTIPIQFKIDVFPYQFPR